MYVELSRNGLDIIASLEKSDFRNLSRRGLGKDQKRAVLTSSYSEKSMNPPQQN